jgi:hypothetical protein
LRSDHSLPRIEAGLIGLGKTSLQAVRAFASANGCGISARRARQQWTGAAALIHANVA